MWVPSLDGGCLPPDTALEFPDFTCHGPSPSHQGEVSRLGSDLPGLAGRGLLPPISFLCCLLCPAGQARMGTVGVHCPFLALKRPGNSKSLEKSGPEQMCLWTAVSLLIARDEL